MPNHQYVRTLLGNMISFIWISKHLVKKRGLNTGCPVHLFYYYYYFLFGFIGFGKFRMRLLVLYLNIFSHYFYDFDVPDMFVNVEDHWLSSLVSVLFYLIMWLVWSFDLSDKLKLLRELFASGCGFKIPCDLHKPLPTRPIFRSKDMSGCFWNFICSSRFGFAVVNKLTITLMLYKVFRGVNISGKYFETKLNDTKICIIHDVAFIIVN